MFAPEREEFQMRGEYRKGEYMKVEGLARGDCSGQSAGVGCARFEVGVASEGAG